MLGYFALMASAFPSKDKPMPKNGRGKPPFKKKGGKKKGK